MILKPFMLRRIKKDVENELSDKIEVMVYCPLTTRQKLLYSGISNIHIHIFECYIFRVFCSFVSCLCSIEKKDSDRGFTALHSRWRRHCF